MPQRREQSVSSVVPDENAGQRLDKYLSDALNLFPRSQIQHRTVSVLVNDAPAKLSHRLRAGDVVVATYTEPVSLELEAEQIPLDILYEDDDLIVINKQAGMVVHPGAGNWSGTVVQALLGHIVGLQAAFGSGVRPGIVHRLDKETTGVLVAAKNPAVSEFLAAQFKNRSTRKLYLAMARGQLSASSGVIDKPIARDQHHRKRFRVVESGGKTAITRFRVLYQDLEYSIVELSPETGRTHQLRVHLAQLGHPIVGDGLYGRSHSRFADLPLMLHARSLELDLPSGERRAFVAPLPTAFLTVWPADLQAP